MKPFNSYLGASRFIEDNVPVDTFASVLILHLNRKMKIETVRATMVNTGDPILGGQITSKVVVK